MGVRKHSCWPNTEGGNMGNNKAPIQKVFLNRKQRRKLAKKQRHNLFSKKYSSSAAKEGTRKILFPEKVKEDDKTV